VKSYSVFGAFNSRLTSILMSMETSVVFCMVFTFWPSILTSSVSTKYYLWL